MPTWSSEQKARAIFPHQIMHGRNPSIYLFGENDSIQAFYIKLTIISNRFDLDWFNSENLASKILILDIAQINIYISNVYGLCIRRIFYHRLKDYQIHKE